MRNVLLMAVALLTPMAAYAERSGEEVYNAKCFVCHSSGVANAPKLGDSAAWSSRADKGIEGLLKTAKTGINAMPPMGTCMDCTDKEMTAAIQYMLDNSK
jgi:cytochrome c5